MLFGDVRGQHGHTAFEGVKGPSSAIIPLQAKHHSVYRRLAACFCHSPQYSEAECNILFSVGFIHVYRLYDAVTRSCSKSSAMQKLV